MHLIPASQPGLTFSLACRAWRSTTEASQSVVMRTLPSTTEHLDDNGAPNERATTISPTEIRVDGERSPAVLPSTPLAFSATANMVTNARAFKLSVRVDNESELVLLQAAELRPQCHRGNISIGMPCVADLEKSPPWLKPGEFRDLLPGRASRQLRRDSFSLRSEGIQCSR